MENSTDPLSIQDVVGILMDSAFYFDLDPKERHSLIQHILDSMGSGSEAELPPGDRTAP
jgi:hypothetical protein